ncbi:DNA starvation/stationary phase protection protein [Aquaticitalea lipolytica]|uniref:DNA starvation/stationary phase protection protein n=2 Tax=Flavobacteriaceae TaxID=49546 RepID=A0A8J2TNI2_9FLAO|nr:MULTISPECIES: DNA starvation/stationary phase protection protein [Flavobacteriaceae]THV60770.1 DNA starvation/stationary phase protection protein [Allomuricauda alvinocaridis]GFZ81703.1 DNA starvation/stationary phase protection protein [Aquaticitalea lipolytica]
MKVNIGISAENRQEVSDILGKILADEFALFLKTKKAHWNVQGSDFKPMHEFFEEQFDQIDGFVDDLAERIRSLGHFPPSSLKEMLELTQLTEKYEEGTTSKDFIKTLLSDHESIIVEIRKNIGQCSDKYKDEGSAGMLGGLLEEHEKMAWMLRSHL